MRLPIRSEADAFRIVYGLAALVGLSLLLGYQITPLVGMIVFTAVTLGLLLVEFRRTDHDRRLPLRDAARAAPRSVSPDRRQILVVANQTLVGEEIRAEIMRRREDRPVLRVVAPVLASRTRYAVSDIDSGLAQARRRLEETLAWAAANDLEATGTVCDQGPLIAIEDELRRFAADEVLISTHPANRSNWLETGLVERVRAELDIPVTHVVVELAPKDASSEPPKDVSSEQ